MAKRGVQLDEELLQQFLSSGGEVEDITPVTPVVPGAGATDADVVADAATPPIEDTPSSHDRPGIQTPVIVEQVAGATSRLNDWLVAQPTPGGVGALVFVLVVLVWAMVPSNEQGYTRLHLLWLTLTGRTQLKDRRVVPPLDSGSGEQPTGGWEPGYTPIAGDILAIDTGLAQQTTPPSPFDTYDFGAGRYMQ